MENWVRSNTLSDISYRIRFAVCLLTINFGSTLTLREVSNSILLVQLYELYWITHMKQRVNKNWVRNLPYASGTLLVTIWQCRSCITSAASATKISRLWSAWYVVSMNRFRNQINYFDIDFSSICWRKIVDSQFV